MQQLLEIRTSKSFCQSNEHGIAFLELLIALPFFLALITGVIDIGRALNEYIQLSNTVSSAVRYGAGVSQLGRGRFYSSSACSGTPAADQKKHELIHQRVSEVVSAQGLAVLPGTLCVVSELVISTGSGVPDAHAKTVFVEVVVQYDALFPIFDGIQIAANARGPYLVQDMLTSGS